MLAGPAGAARKQCTGSRHHRRKGSAWHAMSTDAGPEAELSERISVTLLGMMFLPVLVLAVALALGVGEIRWPLAAASALFAPLLCRARSPAEWIVPFCLAGVVFIICASVYDTSYDGMTYDAAAVLGLLGGYN